MSSFYLTKATFGRSLSVSFHVLVLVVLNLVESHELKRFFACFYIWFEHFAININKGEKS